MKLFTRASIFSVLVCTASASHAQIIDGGFENDLGWTYTGSATPTPYSVYTNIGATNSGPGLRALTFNGGEQAPGSTAVQTFTTVPGTSYTLSLIYGNYGASVPQQLNVRLENGGDLLASSSLIDTTGDTDFSFIFQPASLSFTATGTTTTITMDDLGSTTGNSDLLVDSVAISPVPEPASMAVLGLGLAALKRRRNAKKN